MNSYSPICLFLRLHYLCVNAWLCFNLFCLFLLCIISVPKRVIKRSPIFTKSWPKSSHRSFSSKVTLFKVAQKVCKYLGYFCMKNGSIWSHCFEVTLLALLPIFLSSVLSYILYPKQIRSAWSRFKISKLKTEKSKLKKIKILILKIFWSLGPFQLDLPCARCTTLGGSITVPLTSCLTGLYTTKQLNLLLMFKWQCI